MPRPLRSQTVVPGAPHHIVLRGNNRRRLFSYDGCYLRFLRLLGDASRQHRTPVHAIALMPNHVHLVVTPDDATTLAAFVKHFAQRYAEARNRARGATGKVFEQRFSAFAIAETTRLALTVAYVDLNPVRAGLVEDAAHYRWSTYALHAGGGATSCAIAAIWTPHDWYVDLAGDAEGRGLRYRSWVASRLAEDVESVAGDVDDRDEEETPHRRRFERPDGSTAR